MEKVLYITRSDLPTNAEGLRMDRLSDILEKKGTKVDFISSKRVDEVSADGLLSSDFEFEEGIGLYYQFKSRRYFFDKSQKRSIISSLLNLVELFYQKHFFNRIICYCRKYKPDCVVIYNGLYRLTRLVIRFCKKNDIRVIEDVTEWYEICPISSGVGNRFVTKSVDKRIRKLDRKATGIIAISDFLFDYYKKKGIDVIWIPPLMNFETDFAPSTNECLKFVYAGIPGRKDKLIPILDAVYETNSQKNECKCFLYLIGIDERYLFNNWKNIDYNKFGIFAFGRLPHNDTQNLIVETDFSFLLREKKRYALAGFSTKFAESLSLGIPVICNKIGGCDKLISDGITGFLLEDSSSQTIVTLIDKISNLPSSTLYKMKMDALNFAKSFFLPQIYEDRLLQICFGEKHENNNRS